MNTDIERRFLDASTRFKRKLRSLASSPVNLSTPTEGSRRELSLRWQEGLSYCGDISYVRREERGEILVM